ncbi:MAG: hypothetical protein M3O34_03330, partial [Chloroflexota bacterium]|nr:hypothetical protein [Chloroflexota bacterium]
AWDYIVVYARNLQAGDRPAFLDGALLPWRPEHTVTLNGVEYAWIYDAANGIPVGATYGGLVTLEGYAVDDASVRAGRRLVVRLRWRNLAELPPGLSVQVELWPTGDRSGLRSLHPLASGDGESRGAAGVRYTGRYELPVDPGTPPGNYVLAVRLIDQDGAALPLSAAPPRDDAAPPEPDAVVLRTIQVR